MESAKFYAAAWSGGSVGLIRFEAKSPSNIAVVKYMGKSDSNKNAATNSSISYTLPHLLTTVSIEVTKEVQAVWRPETPDFQLSETGKKKFLAHWDRCHQRLAPHFQQGVAITSGNNFPSDCGLASSASSFAALTEAAYGLFGELGVLEGEWSREELARLSREGSGSSCRSFFGPWVFWEDEKVRAIDSIWTDLRHSVVVVDGAKKKVSSSEAHCRVTSSSLFEGRINRAEKRSEALQHLLKKQDSWFALYELAWAEFWDMHVLFETSSPSFFYMTPKSLMALRYLQDGWEQRGDGPVVTMDAGPNVHLLYRKDQADLQFVQTQRMKELDLAVISTANP
jgi:diphosphomevalonate decarboxylase